MDVKELNKKLNLFFKEILSSVKGFPKKAGVFFKNFPNLSLGEQIAYICIGFGVLLIIISLFLF
jgi:hypothetical protein